MLESMSINMNEFELPIVVEKDKEYFPELVATLDKYSAFIASKRFLSDTVPNINKNIELIKNALKNYFSGRLRSAYDDIYDYISAYRDSKFFFSDINENYAFRGVAPKYLRPSLYNDTASNLNYDYMMSKDLSFYKGRVGVQAFTRQDMLHIPFDDKGKIGNQRFSVSGIPCLYLSTTSWGTWIELNSPENGRFQVSAYKLPDNLKILNLCIQQNFIDGLGTLFDEKERGTILTCLELFPLVIATSFRVKEENRVFHSEYVISQQIMQVCSDLGMSGVAYLSKRVIDSEAYPQAVNLALMMPENFKYRYWSRANEVSLTEPVRMSDFLLRAEYKEKSLMYKSYVNEIYKGKYNDAIKLANQRILYTDTEFSRFDEHIQNCEFALFQNEKF